MIDFLNVKRRVTKHTVQEGEFFLLDISSAEGKVIAEGAGDNAEKIMASFLRALMCDKEGKLLNYTDEQLTQIGTSLLRDVTKAVFSIVYGEKKS